MWYTLYWQATKAYISHTPRPTVPTTDIGVVTTPSEPDEAVVEWSPTEVAWVPRAEPLRRTLSRKEFLDQFTAAELGGALALHDAPDAAVRAMIRVFKLYVVVSGAIELDDPQTVQGLTWLQSLGILTAARVREIRRLPPEPA